MANRQTSVDCDCCGKTVLGWRNVEFHREARQVVVYGGEDVSPLTTVEDENTDGWEVKEICLGCLPGLVLEVVTGGESGG